MSLPEKEIYVSAHLKIIGNLEIFYEVDTATVLLAKKIFLT